MYRLYLIAQVLANFIAAERPQLGGVGAVSELVAESLKAIGDVVKRRGALRKYRTLMGEDSMSYEPLVKQIASDLFDSKTSKVSFEVCEWYFLFTLQIWTKKTFS